MISKKEKSIKGPDKPEFSQSSRQESWLVAANRAAGCGTVVLRLHYWRRRESQEAKTIAARRTT
jgi:hypothetical protein